MLVMAIELIIMVLQDFIYTKSRRTIFFTITYTNVSSIILLLQNSLKSVGLNTLLLRIRNIYDRIEGFLLVEVAVEEERIVGAVWDRVVVLP